MNDHTNNAASSPAPRQPEDRKDAHGTEPRPVVIMETGRKTLTQTISDHLASAALPTGPEAPGEGTPGAGSDRTTGTATAAASQAVRPGEGEHSPTPWCTDDRYPGNVYSDNTLGTCVAECGPRPFQMLTREACLENAERIVTAVNSHGALVAENEALRAGIEKAQQWLDKGSLAYEALDDALLVRAESPAGRHE